MDILSQSRTMQQINKFDQFADENNNKQNCNGDFGNLQTEKNYFLDAKCDPTKIESSIQKLRIAIKDCKLHNSQDEYLYKWLLVNGFDVSRAEKMLRQSLEWRQVNGVDNILETYTPSEVYQKYFSSGRIGVDKFGCPVFLQCPGKTDVKGLMLCSSKKDLLNFPIWLLESELKATEVESERAGKLMLQSTQIVDYEGFSMRTLYCKAAMDSFMYATRLKNAHYPDNARRLFIINAPPFFPLILALIKPFIHESEMNKIKVFGSDKKQWTAALLEEIEADQLPAFYGGAMVDPDGNPLCLTKCNMGGKIPSSYYLSNNVPVAKDYMQAITIGAGGKKKLKYDVDVARSTLKWEFMTEGGDLKFRVYNSKITNDLIPLSQVESHSVMEEGELICDQPGQYIFEFDNGFSYLRSKKLHYHILVNPPISSENVKED